MWPGFRPSCCWTIAGVMARHHSILAITMQRGSFSRGILALNRGGCGSLSANRSARAHNLLAGGKEHCSPSRHPGAGWDYGARSALRPRGGRDRCRGRLARLATGRFGGAPGCSWLAALRGTGFDGRERGGRNRPPAAADGTDLRGRSRARSGLSPSFPRVGENAHCERPLPANHAKLGSEVGGDHPIPFRAVDDAREHPRRSDDPSCQGRGCLVAVAHRGHGHRRPPDPRPDSLNWVALRLAVAPALHQP
jgi:hypothetical protein